MEDRSQMPLTLMTSSKMHTTKESYKLLRWMKILSDVSTVMKQHVKKSLSMSSKTTAQKPRLCPTWCCCTQVLVDNGVRMNTVTLTYTLTHHLQVRSITELQTLKAKIPIQGVGGFCIGPLGYIIMRVRIEGKPSYRSGVVNSKSFVSKVLLQIKWKFKFNSNL